MTQAKVREEARKPKYSTGVMSAVAKTSWGTAATISAALASAPDMAAEIVAAAPQEVFATAEGVPTPVLYFGFLIASFGVAVGTFIALSKVKLI